LAWAGSDEFLGEWQISVIDRPLPDDPTPEQLLLHGCWKEVKCPQRLKVYREDGVLKGDYTDQFGQSASCDWIELANDGQDLLFALAGTTKHPDSIAPLHRAKLVEGKLRGFCFTDRKLFDWVGERQTQGE
jgi:hypothetical protein